MNSADSPSPADLASIAAQGGTPHTPHSPDAAQTSLDTEESRETGTDPESAGMGQNASSPTSQQLERLQQQLKESIARAEAGSVRSRRGSHGDGEGSDDDSLYMVPRRGRSRSTSHGVRNARPDTHEDAKGKVRPRPASTIATSSSAWARQLSSVTFPPRKSVESLRSLSGTSSLQHDAPASLSTVDASSTSNAASIASTSPRERNPAVRGTSASPKFGRRSPKPSPTPSFRHSLRLPFLPSIPASPLPPILSPGLTRSASSPPILPAIPLTASLSPTLELTPPTAGLSPAPETWPLDGVSDTSVVPTQRYHRPPNTSASAPNLTLLASAPIAGASTTTLAMPIDAVFPPPAHDSLTFGPDVLAVDLPPVSSPVDDKVPNRSQRDEKRYHALVELVETETGYLEHLRALVKVYFQTLPFLTLLSTFEVEAVVRNAEALLELHERISDRLEEVDRQLNWRGDRHGEASDAGDADKSERVHKATHRIAKVFSDELPNFHLYNDFCARHAEALDVTRRLAHRPEWEAYERQCALRVASQGDITPLASRTNSATTSPFFPTVPLPPISTSLPSSASQRSHSVSPSPTTSPSQSTATLPLSSSVPAPSSTSASRSRAKLRFADFAIAPVQRIMRYPLVLGSLAKYCEGEPDEHGQDEVQTALAGMKTVAEGVDAAKREREGEIRTRIVASRMEFQATVSVAFCDILGPTILVGALHVLHRSTLVEPLRVKYYGCFLYKSHLILAKIKKRASYEPREWLPLRLFDITSLEEGHGLLSQSIRLVSQDHVLELGALCPAEKAIWLDRLLTAQAEARRVWNDQPRDADGKATLFDETLISSVSPVPPSTTTTPRKAHQRSSSSVSVTSVLAAAASTPSTSSNSPFIAQDEPLPALPADSALLASAPPLASINSNTTPTLSNRSRFSNTASSLLGRTPSAQRAAVDLRLADVFSEECLAARASAAREVELDEAGRRHRTMSGPKRSMTAGFTGSSGHSSSSHSVTGKMLGVKDRRRMSSFELEMGRASVADFRAAAGFDSGLATLPQEDGPIVSSAMTTPERKWASAIRKTKSAGSRARPALPEIDTALAEAMNRKHRVTGEKQAPLTAVGTGSWGSRAADLRRVASHSSLEGPVRSPSMSVYVAARTPTASSAVRAESAAAALAAGTADVERNNSVSSSTSSNGTATNSSSSHSHGLHLIETPPSSIPPSPDFCALELVEPFPPTAGSTSLKPSLSTRSTTSRWGTHALQDGMSSVFRIKRRKSTLGLVPAVSSFAPADGEDVVASGPPQPPPHTRHSTSTSTQSSSSTRDNSDSSSNTAGAKLSRRSSTFGEYFQKRVQSSPTLTGFFASALGSTSSPHLPLSSAPASIAALNSPTASSDTPSDSSYHTPNSLPATPEIATSELPSPVESKATPAPAVSKTTATMPTTTTPRKKSHLASKVGRTVSSTFGHMGRQRSSEGASGGPSNASSTSALTLTNRRFHFNRQNGMTPLS
ncbi:hypothetical protein JCM10212_005512 [Sporobolomyces blumeae]